MTAQRWAQTCHADGEFSLAAREWTGAIRFVIGTHVIALTLTRGTVSAADPGAGAGVLTYSASVEVWEKLLAASPPRLFNDIAPLLDRGALSLEGDELLHAQYFAAVARALELLRPTGLVPAPLRDEGGDRPRFDTPVGRYLRLELDGADYRVYVETAGTGIPLMLQHTAGSDSSQWRHLFEVPEITAHFRLIAYDLPYHGKSLPPSNSAWWAQRYRLGGRILRSVPLGVAGALGLHRPVFMGCSVGGLLALDLALHHPDVFHAVVAIGAALKIDEDTPDSLQAFWHPQVSDDYKARSMEGLMSPTSPVSYRKETAFAYASGWPQAFLGDLHYYQHEYDLRDKAGQIDTAQVGVHILCGEYDWSGSLERGRAVHEAIAGSTWTPMSGVGHFPMSENPVVFLQYLLPVLEKIRTR